jgi:hypothetical protein
MVKIKSMRVQGIRGIKGGITMPLESQSAIIYGGNGSGKSSIVDAVEWFYGEKITHLDRGGNDELVRNTELALNDLSEVQIVVGDVAKDNTRAYELTKGKTPKLEKKLLNESDDNKAYLEKSADENLTFRHADLVKLGLQGGSKMVGDISSAIGLEEFTKFEKEISAARKEIENILKDGGFDALKKNSKDRMTTILSEVVTNKPQFIKAVNSLLEVNGFKERIAEIADTAGILQTLSEGNDTSVSKSIAEYNSAESDLIAAKTVSGITAEIQAYIAAAKEVFGNKEKNEKLSLLKVLVESKNAISSGIVKDNKCPVCQQDKDTALLLKELNSRISELDVFKKLKDELDAKRAVISSKLSTNTATFTRIAGLKNLDGKTLEGLSNIIESLKKASVEIKKELPASAEEINTEPLDLGAKYCSEKAAELGKSLADNKNLKMHSNITSVTESYKVLENAENESSRLDVQFRALDKLCTIIKTKKEAAMSAFINLYAAAVSSYYSLINPGENVTGIRLEKAYDNYGVLKAVNVAVDIFSKQSKPEDYLSESHINGLGLAFFLASLNNNKENDFVFFDDILSSFDLEHRKRLFELFCTGLGGRQVILLTHDKAWFDLVGTDATNAGWYKGTIASDGVGITAVS